MNHLPRANHLALLAFLTFPLAIGLAACGDTDDAALESEESISLSSAGSLSGEPPPRGDGDGGVVPPTSRVTPSNGEPTPSGNGPGSADTGPQPSIPSLSLPGNGEEDERLDGAPCSADAQCIGGTCMAWPDGYCTTLDCTTREDCLNTQEYGCLPGQGQRPSMCVLLCEEAEDCRVGYICRPAGNASYCAPDPDRPPESGPSEPPATGGGVGEAQDGDPCASAGDCIGDKCLTGSDWPGGYCSTTCVEDEDCNRAGIGAGGFALPGAVCSGGTCYTACAAGFGCREGYQCDDSLSEAPAIGGCVGP